MTNTKELLSKIAVLRDRIERMQVTPHERGQASLHEETPAPYSSPPRPQAPTQLTFRAAQLLREARGLVADLKALADDPLVRDGDISTQNLQREAAGVLDVILRNLINLPDGAAAQLRHCEGLQTCLATARDTFRMLETTLIEQRREVQRVELLATLLRRLDGGDALDLSPFIALAAGIVDEAIEGAPLRFRSNPSGDVARFAAHHGLNVARVQAWLLRGETQRQRLAELLVPALIHDVGMLSVPPEIVFKAGPLDDAERILINRHPLKSLAAARLLYPGGGWPVDAVADHHERLDGSGYPVGKKSLALGDATRLLAVCDVYAALASPRPHRLALDTRTALADTLLAAERGQLDRPEAEKLLRLSFYPPGSVVQLSDGATALVVAVPKTVINPAKVTVIPLRTVAGCTPAYPWPIDLADANGLSIIRALTAAERAKTLGRSHPALV